jgi:ParB family chromosome partitioning protein
LSDLLDTRVSVEMGRRRGKLVVEFGSIEDLERILGQITPGALSALHGDQEPFEPAQDDGGGSDY